MYQFRPGNPVAVKTAKQIVETLSPPIILMFLSTKLCHEMSAAVHPSLTGRGTSGCQNSQHVASDIVRKYLKTYLFSLPF